MKTTLLALGASLAACFGQFDRPTYNKETNALIKPTAAEFRAANSMQLQGSKLDVINANTGTLDIGGVTFNVPAATTFGGVDRAIIGNVGPGNVTLSYPGSSDYLIVYKLSVATAFIAPTIADDSTSVLAGSSYAGAATSPILHARSGNAAWTGPVFRAEHSPTGAKFEVNQLGSVSWSGTATGAGSGITALNASSLASGTVAHARLGTGGGTGAKFLRDDSTFQKPNIETDITGILPGANGGPARWANDAARAAVIPAVTGQVGYQLDTAAIWLSIGTSAGDWSNSIHLGIANVDSLDVIGDAFLEGALIVEGDLQFSKTIIAPGTTTTPATINKNSGAINMAIGATSFVVNNSLVTTASIITATVASNDTTTKSVAVVAGSGVFTLYPNAAPTAETRVNFRVTN